MKFVKTKQYKNDCFDMLAQYFIIISNIKKIVTTRSSYVGKR